MRPTGTPYDIATRYGGDAARASYAQAYGALLAHHRIDATCRTVEVAMPGGRAPTFVVEAGTGVPVLFLHGTPATSAVWTPLLEHLDDVHAYLVDRPGHGLSAAFDYTGLTDLRTHAVDFVTATLDALGLERVVVAGSSLGGLWSLWTALDRPERVSGLLLAGAPPGLFGPRLPAIFGVLSVPWTARLLRRLDPPSAASTRRFFARMGDPPEALGEVFVEAFTRSQPIMAAAAAQLIQRFVRLPARFARRDLWLDADELARVRQPTLFLWGARDFVGGMSLGHRAAAAMPRAELAEVGVGHLPWLQDPSGAAAAIHRFLGKPSPSPEGR